MLTKGNTAMELSAGVSQAPQLHFQRFQSSTSPVTLIPSGVISSHPGEHYRDMVAGSATSHIHQGACTSGRRRGSIVASAIWISIANQYVQ